MGGWLVARVAAARAVWFSLVCENFGENFDQFCWVRRNCATLYSSSHHTCLVQPYTTHERPFTCHASCRRETSQRHQAVAGLATGSSKGASAPAIRFCLAQK